MTLRIASEDVGEVRSALSTAYKKVIWELGQSRELGAGPARVALCRRKWSLEAILRQLDGPEEPPAALQLVPRRGYARLEQVAA